MRPLAILFAAMFALSATSADARNTPCSKKKGGIASCTKDGKFRCNDGSVSKSKRSCRD